MQEEKEYKSSFAMTIHKKMAMSDRGIKRWGVKQRRHIHRYVYPTVMHIKEMPVEILSKDEKIIEWFCKYFNDGDELYAFKYNHVKKKYPLKTHIFTIRILNKENNKAEINTTVRSKTGRIINRLDRYWFRKL